MNDVIDNTTPGDKVEIVSKDKTLKGTVMPGEPGVVVIKLSSGYNIGINKNNIRSIKLIEKHKEVKQKKNKISKNQKLPTISLLHTGGTIASKVDYVS
jgi:glutamyl-tRNA(Gln) amidotransferase subunit D